eukprot:2734522-Pyramimonas_sp.AAC.1
MRPRGERPGADAARRAARTTPQVAVRGAAPEAPPPDVHGVLVECSWHGCRWNEPLTESHEEHVGMTL